MGFTPVTHSILLGQKNCYLPGQRELIFLPFVRKLPWIDLPCTKDILSSCRATHLSQQTSKPHQIPQDRLSPTHTQEKLGPYWSHNHYYAAWDIAGGEELLITHVGFEVSMSNKMLTMLWHDGMEGLTQWMEWLSRCTMKCVLGAQAYCRNSPIWLPHEHTIATITDRQLWLPRAYCRTA